MGRVKETNAAAAQETNILSKKVGLRPDILAREGTGRGYGLTSVPVKKNPP